jgi:catechol 2,3-dioxygenase
MTPIDPELKIRCVELAVADVALSADFYEQVLGLPLIAREADRATLGTDARHPALTLRELRDPAPTPHHASGLFHVAWLHPTRAALADSVRRVAGARRRFDGAADHGVSEALYLSDPDGLGIELYVDRPREQWERPPDGHGVKMVSEALDLDDLLACSTGEASAAMPAGTAIGHVHLKVADVPRAAVFYRDALGMDEQARLPSAAFLSAGGYHHHIGLNSWQSRGASPPPANTPGLRLIEFELSGDAALDALAANLESSTAGAASAREGGGLLLAGPDAESLAFVAG